MFAVAIGLVKPGDTMRPPRPARGVVQPKLPLPGARFNFAVACPAVKPKVSLRPPRPANFWMKPEKPAPGAPFLR